MITKDLLAPLEHYSAEQFKVWLMDGTRKMCGADSDIEKAFAPISDSVGGSREISWIKDLAVVYTMLSSSASLKFNAGLNSALSEVSGKLSNQDWEVALMLVDLMREVDAHPRMPSIKVLADRIPLLSTKAQKKLALIALMATFETRPSERLAAQAVARQLSDLAYTLFADRKQEVSNRLLPDFIKLEIPIGEQDEQKNGFSFAVSIRNRLTRGICQVTQDGHHAPA